MIVTRQRRIPFIWVIMAMMPWAFWYFQMLVNGVNFFILNRLIDNPATLTFVLALPGLLFTILPLGSYISFSPTETTDVETYTPDYLLPKLMLVAVGLLVAGVALRQAWPDLKLLVYGEHAEGIVTAVVMQKQGLPEITLKTQAELIARTHEVATNKDYGWNFYDEFAFETPDGKEVIFRRDIGCKLRPTLPLLDDSGLPTTAMLRYDPRDPAGAILPLEYSTWFALILISVLAIMSALTGAILAWYARKPIVLHSSMSVNIGQTS